MIFVGAKVGGFFWAMKDYSLVSGAGEITSVFGCGVS